MALLSLVIIQFLLRFEILKAQETVERPLQGMNGKVLSQAMMLQKELLAVGDFALERGLLLNAMNGQQMVGQSPPYAKLFIALRAMMRENVCVERVIWLLASQTVKQTDYNQ